VNLRRILVVGAVLVAAALAGCEPAQLGSAAIVDGKRIEVDAVQGAVSDVRALQDQIGQPAQAPETLARGELQRRLILAVYERAARELGVRVTAGEVSSEMSRLRQAAGSEEEFARQVAGQNLSMQTVDEYVRQALLARKFGPRLHPLAGATPDQAAQDAAVTERLIQTAKKMRFEVNPRYGDFDTGSGQLAEHRDDFVRPAATPGAAP
jgi:hypothetical protein